jgi:hypothetical protein
MSEVKYDGNHQEKTISYMTSTVNELTNRFNTNTQIHDKCMN